MRSLLLALPLSIVMLSASAAELGDAYVKLFQVQLQLANTGHAGAQYSIGEMYEQGLGTEVDINKAYEWYEKSAKQGDVRARHKLTVRAAPEDPVEEPGAPVTPARQAAKPAQKTVATAPQPARKPTPEEVDKMRAAAEAILAKQKQRGSQGDIGW